ncbi:hypothetical protein HPB51_027300 [Rhipicephalus microplus]|uniref:Uncharacterized protein n=1 Tax=Rhipicephalus microplus TaxID=6941 RepID=A0A9J6D0F0_RHIMP|nr:hypothetical protein HPB51_027300 [Rhipicephalus microplus]
MPAMTRQTAAVLWRTLAIESIKRHYVLSLLEVLIVLILALLFLSTKFVTQPTTEQGQLRQAVVSTGEDIAGTGQGVRTRRYEFDDDQYPDNDDDDDNEDGDDDDKEHDNSGGDKNTTEEECGLYSPWEAINYNGEVQVASLCAYEGCVVCVHFRTLTNSTLEYALHLYEDENPGQKGLDIGFRRPREFFYDPEMDRQLWEAINYNGEVQVAALCAYEGCVVCVHFRTLTNLTLEYALHLYEDENPGQKGLDIGFRRPREFFYDPEMDRQLWGWPKMPRTSLNIGELPAGMQPTRRPPLLPTPTLPKTPQREQLANSKELPVRILCLDSGQGPPSALQLRRLLGFSVVVDHVAPADRCEVAVYENLVSEVYVNLQPERLPKDAFMQIVVKW